MKLRYLQFFAIIVWGLQSDLLIFAIPMAIIWEGQFFFNRRWTLTQQDFYRTADLTSVALVCIFIFLFMNRAEYHFLITLSRWSPILIFPLVVVMAYSTSDKMTLDVLFYSLRRQKQPVTQHWDMNYALFAFCIMAAATNKQDFSFYLPFSAVLISLALLRLRSKRYSTSVWLLLVTFSFLFAFGLQSGIRETHIELKQRANVWLTNWVQQRNNPAKYLSSIGSVGRLKVSDKILFRVDSPNNNAIPSLLQETSYDLPSGKDWGVMDQNFTNIAHLDDFAWQLNPEASNESLVDIYLEFYKDSALIPLPTGTSQVYDLPAQDLRRNYYGTVQAKGLVPSPRYRIKLQDAQNFNGPPTKIDTYVPERYKVLMSSIIKDNQLDTSQPIKSVYEYFKDFRYSLYQTESVKEKPIEYFMKTSQAGHCEYFASSSVYLLREMGIPARYVVGFSVQEYSDVLDMYVVRQRHAHAWAIAYINEKWQVVDTTPSIWLDEEADEGFFAQPIFDLFANANFMFKVWWNDLKIEDYEDYLYAIGAILSLILLWRIMIGEKVIIANRDEKALYENSLSYGADSPFFKLADKLVEKGFTRGRGELPKAWLTRIGFPHLIRLLPSHEKWRFDPSGLAIKKKESLALEVAAEIDKLNEEDQTSS
ncbi:MAG: transglutaminase-like putative cysteine protease [Candidatus Azotimanducaceae bacterium]|jgi:transglutaminase-like putative cysteine protease